MNKHDSRSLKLKYWNPTFSFLGFFLSLCFFYFPFSLSFHVFLSNQFARAPNSESYEFIIRPCCVIEGVFNFMQMISNSSILGSKFWKENWGLIFEAFWKSFETKKKERKKERKKTKIIEMHQDWKQSPLRLQKLLLRQFVRRFYQERCLHRQWQDSPNWQNCKILQPIVLNFYNLSFHRW